MDRKDGATESWDIKAQAREDYFPRPADSWNFPTAPTLLILAADDVCMRDGHSVLPTASHFLIYQETKARNMLQQRHNLLETNELRARCGVLPLCVLRYGAQQNHSNMPLFLELQK